MASPISSFSTPLGTPAYRPQRTTPFSTRYGAPVTQIMSQRENKTGGYDAQGQALKPGTQVFSPGWNAKWGQDYFRQGRSGSAAGAVGSSGIPTSQRGRAEKFGGFADDGQGGFFQPNIAAAETPSWAMSNMMMNNGGLSQSWRYGGMGQPPQPNVSSVTPAAPAPQVQPQAPVGNDPWAGRTTYGPNAAATPQPNPMSPLMTQGLDWFKKLFSR